MCVSFSFFFPQAERRKEAHLKAAMQQGMGLGHSGLAHSALGQGGFGHNGLGSAHAGLGGPHQVCVDGGEV